MQNRVLISRASPSDERREEKSEGRKKKALSLAFSLLFSSPLRRG